MGVHIGFDRLFCEDVAGDVDYCWIDAEGFVLLAISKLVSGRVK